MNAIRKADFIASAVIITLVGSAFVTAPLAFAGSDPVLAHHAGTVSVSVPLNGAVQ